MDYHGLSMSQSLRKDNKEMETVLPTGSTTLLPRTPSQSMTQQKKLTIVAATGRVGRQLLEQAVVAGHDVTAVARNPGKLTRQVRTVTADLAAADPTTLEAARPA